MYNVYDGDYPVIKGDMQLFWITNDENQTTLNYLFQLDFELIYSLYGYECSGDGLVDNTLFMNVRGYNGGSSVNYLRMGLWLDTDIGCNLDDYIGSIPSVNSFFAYNQNANDGQGGCSGISSFGTTIPIQSMTYLNHPLTYFTYYVNDAPDPGLSQPDNILYYGNFLRGYWSDGMQLTYGGNGRGSGNPYNFAFDGNPSDTSSWTMADANLDPSYAYRHNMLGSTYIGNFSNGGQFDVDLAFITHENIPHPNPDITPVSQRITQVQNYYDNETLTWDVYLGPDKSLTVGQPITLVVGIEGGNTTNYSYLWSTGETTASINATAPITYSVTVTNNITGCSKTDAIQVSFPANTEELVNEMDKNCHLSKSSSRCCND